MGYTFGFLFILSLFVFLIALIFLWGSIETYLCYPHPAIQGLLVLSCGAIALYSGYLMYAFSSTSKTVDTSDSTETVPISAVGTSSSGSGMGVNLGLISFYRFTDSGDYIVLAKADDGGYQKTVLPADSTTVYPDGDGSPSYEKVTSETTTSYIAYVFPFGKLTNEETEDFGPDVTYKLHVPADSIASQGYDLV